jgi:defect-in-organelle-trafficking protein DotC
MKFLLKILSSSLFVAILSTNALADVTTQKFTSAESLKKLEYSDSLRKEGIVGGLNPGDVRYKEMKNTALAIGAQNGYVSRLNDLKKEIDARKGNLDDIYDFSVIMKLSGGQLDELYLLPPVISVSKNITAVSDGSDRIRISGIFYSIDKPARLVTIAPNWRQYLLFDQPVQITQPIANLLPKTPDEKNMWSSWIDDGWIAGNSQAEREMTYRVRKLGQDYKGMTRYMILAQEGKVTKPVISSSTQNVAGGGTTMRVNDKVVQLSLPASLNANSNDWASLILDARESIRYPDEKKVIEKNR